MKMISVFVGLCRKSAAKGTGGIAAKGIVIVLGMAGSLLGLPMPAMAQNEPAFTNLTRMGVAVEMEWTNGAPIFLLQRKLDLANDLSWVDILTTSNSEAMVPQDAPTAFYRLQSGVTNTVVPFSVLLDGPSEVPTNASPAIAVGTLSLQTTNLTYYINFSGLSGNATAAHIHAPAATTNSAGVMVGLTIPAATSGVMTGTVVLTPDQITNIVNGWAYINIHTSLNPGGEIRSHIVPLHIPMILDNASHVPQVASNGVSWGALTLVGSKLFYTINYSNLTSSANQAHIHGPAGPGANAGVLVTLATPSGTNGTISGTATLTPLQLNYLLKGLTYINIHTISNTPGEIRGQIWPIQLGTSPNGTEAGTGSAGSGSAFMTILGNVLTYNVTFTNLSTSATAGHIHGPAFRGGTAGVTIGFSSVPFATSGTISGTATVTSQQLYWLMTGQTYVNIHTINFPGGEIRGQLVPLN